MAGTDSKGHVMTTSAQLRDIATRALKGKTDAGSNVYSPRDVPTWPGEYPVLFLTTPDEEGQAWSRSSGSAFTVTSTLRVTARMEHNALDDDAGAQVVYLALEALREQIKYAVINFPELMAQLQQFPFFRCHIQGGNGSESETHQGQLEVDIGMEFIQTAEDFFQAPSAPLEGIDLTIVEPDGTTETGLTIDLPAADEPGLTIDITL